MDLDRLFSADELALDYHSADSEPAPFWRREPPPVPADPATTAGPAPERAPEATPQPQRPALAASSPGMRGWELAVAVGVGAALGLPVAVAMVAAAVWL